MSDVYIGQTLVRVLFVDYAMAFDHIDHNTTGYYCALDNIIFM